MIYFIKNQDYVKIGFTTNIKKRVKEFQISSPHKIKVLGLIEGTMKEEQELHSKFQHIAAYGEWFEYTNEMKRYIAALDDTLLWKYGYLSSTPPQESMIKSCIEELNIPTTTLSLKYNMTYNALFNFEKREREGGIKLKSLRDILDKLGYKLEMRAIKKAE